ncbi:MAG: phosphoribosylformylglycinamidine cyclo-ligase [bacterium]
MGKAYKSAGVDIEANEAFVEAIRSAVESTHGPDVVPIPAGFAGELALLAGGKMSPGPKQTLFARQFKDPVLVAATDGVGTKLKVAFAAGIHDTVGVDLVAMSINDLIANGAVPLFFLDYLAFTDVPNEVQVEVVRGIARACREAGCALLGGERAELPGFYKKGEYDLAGFAVGIVERAKRIDGSKARPGDAIVGIAATGLHSNGYSLARKVLLDQARLGLGEHVDELDCTLGEELLRPTAIYARPLHAVLRHYKVKAGVRAIANITGGGLIDNVPRTLPARLGARISKSAWPRPPIFDLIQRLGGIDEDEMYRVFNMGIGMTLVVPPTYARSIIRQLGRQGRRAYVIGRVRRGPHSVELMK